MWIAMVGCVGDWFLPEFSKDFKKKYPKLWTRKKIRNPGTILHETELGRLCRIMQFNLKGQSRQVLDAIRLMTRIKDPYQIIEGKTQEGKSIYRNFEQINKVYEDIRSRVQVGREKLIVFEYNDGHALTADLSNEIQYYNPDKLILIAREKNDEMKCSLRSEEMNVRKILEASIIGIEGYGGGHEHACGAAVKKKDFDRFVLNLKSEIDKVTTSK